MAPPSPSGRGPQTQTQSPTRPTNPNQQPQCQPPPWTRTYLLLLAALLALLTGCTPQCARAQTTGPPPMTLPQRAGRGRWEGRGKGELTAAG